MAASELWLFFLLFFSSSVPPVWRTLWPPRRQKKKRKRSSGRRQTIESCLPFPSYASSIRMSSARWLAVRGGQERGRDGSRGARRKQERADRETAAAAKGQHAALAQPSRCLVCVVPALLICTICGSASHLPATRALLSTISASRLSAALASRQLTPPCTLPIASLHSHCVHLCSTAA